MIILLCWAIIGVIGMLMMSWADAQEEVRASIADPRNVGRRTFKFGHVLAGVLLGPIAFVFGLLYVFSVTPIMEYLDTILSLPLFTWRSKRASDDET